MHQPMPTRRIEPVDFEAVPKQSARWLALLRDFEILISFGPVWRSGLIHASKVLFPVLVLTASLGIIGCGGDKSSKMSSPSTPITLSGHLLGDGAGNPISGSAVTLFAMGSAYKAGATSLASATSKADGSFDFGPFVCPSPTTNTYIVGIGGHSIATNSAIGLMASLGKCGNLNPSTLVVVNELTTVAGEYALAQFTDSTGQNIGAPSSNAIGLNNAINVGMSNLADTTNGSPAGFLPILTQCASGSPPVNCNGLTKINTLANILAACVNSSGPSGTACSTLFANTSTPANATTLMAIHMIATNPAMNVRTIFGVQGTSASQAFQPTLLSAPSDWTVSLNYSGGGLNLPIGVAVDSVGSVWITNVGNHPNSNVALNPSTTVSKFSSNGTDLSSGLGFSAPGLSNPAFVAVDGSDNAWITNIRSNAVTELTSNGSPATGSPFTGGGTNLPVGIAVDQSGNIWIANAMGNSVTELRSNGAAAPGSPFLGGGLSSPIGLAVDGSGNIWTANNFGQSGSVSELNKDGIALSPSTGYTGGGLSGPFGLAIAPGNKIWVGNTGVNAVSELDSHGVAIAGSPFRGGGIKTAALLATDSSGRVWLANFGDKSISELESNGIPVSPVGTGYAGAGLSLPTGVAVDASGNLWVVNNGDGSNCITEFIGLAAPVKTPLTGPPTLP